MGVSYTDGTLPKDPAAAAAWFKLAADQGDADGQVEMAKCFQAGPHMSNFSSL
jgi:TPR repeat protein